MPKVKRGSPKLSRRVKSGHQKRGNGVGTESNAKKEAMVAATRSTTAPPGAAEPATPADIAPSASRKRKRTGTAKRVAKSRAAAPKAPERRRLAAAALKVPKNLGATAAGRYSAFAREGRSDASAERLARYHSEQAGRLRTALRKKLGPSYKPYDHAKPSMAIEEGVADSCRAGGRRLFTCWGNRGCSCGGIRKRYKIPKEEQGTGRTAHQITFSTYEYVPYDSKRYPTKPGEKQKKRYMLVKKTLPFGEFHAKHYIPELIDYDYHHN